MRTKSLFIYTSAGLLASILGFQVLAAPQGARKSVWSGVYTTAQAERGKAVFEKTCIRCHAANLEGVLDATILGDFAPRFPIKGAPFMDRWREDNVHSLVTFIQGGMPPRTDPTNPVTPLTREAVQDVVAYLFQANGFPPGNEELGATEMRYIRIQEKDGPRPLISFTRVQVVGCFMPYQPGTWQLTTATEPLRVRNLSEPSEDEIKAAQTEPEGTLEFDLQNVGYLGRQFTPVEYRGQRVLVRGILLRQPPIIRIDVRSLVPLSQSCQ
jgi:cytochrome c5